MSSLRARGYLFEDKWLQNLKKENAMQAKKNPMVRKLFDKLLGVGGKAVVYADDDPDLGIVVKRGKKYKGPIPKVPKIVLNRCHKVSAELYARNPSRYKIVTGYVLGNDKAWRAHSWILDNGKPKEPTPTKRDIYFGTVLNAREAKKFARGEGCKIDG